jgi:hypothetical protein
MNSSLPNLQDSGEASAQAGRGNKPGSRRMAQAARWLLTALLETSTETLLKTSIENPQRHPRRLTPTQRTCNATC